MAAEENCFGSCGVLGVLRFRRLGRMRSGAFNKVIYSRCIQLRQLRFVGVTKVLEVSKLRAVRQMR